MRNTVCPARQLCVADDIAVEIDRGQIRLRPRPVGQSVYNGAAHVALHECVSSMRAHLGEAQITPAC
ncbi:hypothetical protein RAJCM14343_2976 [Rhodococcus aetherivorans]|uniref:Ferredoxin n=1 Tax=Rhodococcus aetherivorans TaxID=191292 RepID=A0ABQ0YMC1_9NOCA|nr:hypothetical protein RAJCM14343_2976 [Rhodococcus aetherivorans]